MSIMFITDCQLTAFIMDTVRVLIKVPALFIYLFSLSSRLFLCGFHFFWPLYLEVDAGSVSEGLVECCVLFVRTLYHLSSFSLCSGRTICLLLSVGRDRLNGMGWAVQDPLSPKLLWAKTGLWFMAGVDEMITWNLMGFHGGFSTLLPVHLNILMLLVSALLSLSHCACICYCTYLLYFSITHFPTVSCYFMMHIIYILLLCDHCSTQMTREMLVVRAKRHPNPQRANKTRTALRKEHAPQTCQNVMLSGEKPSCE